MPKQLIKKNDGLVFASINYIAFFILAFLCFYPFYYIFIYSISDSAQLAKQTISFFPAGFSLYTYSQIFERGDVYHSFFISASRAVAGTLITIVCTSFFSYLLSKKEMFMRKTMYRLTVISMYANAGLVPWYVTMKGIGLKNSFLLYILPTAIGAFYVVLFKTYVEQLPPALEEAALIDGAGFITTFARIIFPVSMPIIATIAIFSAVSQWNSWQDNLFLCSEPKLTTLQLMLFNFLTSNTATSMRQMSMVKGGRIMTPEAIKMTMCMITVLPIIIVYPSLQKYFIKGIMLGAVKG